MKRTGTILFGLLLVALCFNAVQAINLDITVVAPSASGGNIAGGAGNTFTLDFYFDYTGTAGDAALLGGTSGYYFYSPDGSITDITHVNVSGEGPFQSITTSSDWDTYIATFGTFVNQGGAYEIGYNGVLPDSVYVSGLTSNGLPINFGNALMYSFNLEVLEAVGATEGTLCVDSAGAHPNYGDDLDWLWPLDYAGGDNASFNGGAGAYCWTITGLTPTDVTIMDTEDNLPTEFGLSQNYPNPFNPTTTFEFALPTKANVEIQVFNVLGQKVTTLANQEYPAGVYQVTWDGTNDAGQQIASGIYFYTMNAGDFSETRKLMMLK